MIILKENGTAFFFEMEYCGFDITNAFIYRDINVTKEVRIVLFYHYTDESTKISVYQNDCDVKTLTIDL